MSESGNFDDRRGDGVRVDTPVDPYITESSADIYATPEVSMDAAGMIVDEAPQAAADTHGLFSGSGQAGAAYTEQPVIPYGSQANIPYGGQMYNSTYDGMNNSPYYNNPYQGSGSNSNNGNPYQENNAYGNTPYNGNNAYGNGPYNQDASYGANPYQAGNGYNNYNHENTYGAGNGYGGNGYGSPYNGGNPYGGQQSGGGYGGQPPYGNQPFQDNNPYSPYAAPQKKSHTGLIITIVVIVILLFIVAICALAYRAVQLLDESDIDEIIDDGKYEFDDDYEYHYDYDDDFYGYDYDDDYFYDGDYDYDYDYDDGYYSLQDDLKYDLFYGVEFDLFEYETQDENVNIMVTYPIITGEDVPNLEHLNDTLYSEVELLKEYFEEDYAPYMDKNEDSYFSATAMAYVTYMDEEKLSIVFQERVYADTYDLAYLECFNIDMASGVVLDKEEMLSVDDDFSVEFRTRSDEQNGEIYSLTNMTDQEITSYFQSSDVIVFYTPIGMEIGFNYEDGWVTVTYEEYEQYLNVF